MRLRLADPLRERHRDRLGNDEPVRHVDVRAHPHDVDRHALGNRARLREGGRCQDEDLRQGDLLALPRARRAFVIAHHRFEHERRQRAHAARRGDRVFARDRVALLRHRARAAAAGRVGLEHLADLRLHQQHDVGRELRDAAARDCEGRRARGQARTVGMPRRVGRPQSELAGECERDGTALRAQRRERSDGAAELHDEGVVARGAQRDERLAERREPHRALVAEGERQRVLEVGAAGHHVVAVDRSPLGERADHAREIRFEERERVAHLEHERRVHDVLRGRAPVHVRAGFGAREPDEFLRQRDDGVADIFRPRDDRGAIEFGRARSGRGDRVGRPLRHDAEGRLGARERGLDVQHGLDPAFFREDRAHRERAVQPPEERRFRRQEMPSRSYLAGRCRTYTSAGLRGPRMRGRPRGSRAPPHPRSIAVTDPPRSRPPGRRSRPA